MTRAVSGCAAVVLALLLLAGCGSNGESAQSGARILRDAAAALRSVSSFRMSGQVNTSGGGSFTFEVSGRNQGRGTFTTGSLNFQLEEIHSTDYIRSSTLWASVGGGALQSLLSGHWVSIPAANPLAEQLTGGLAALTSSSQTAAALAKGEAGARRAGTRSYRGREVVVVSERGGASVLVAASGAPYPLRLNDGKGTSLELSAFGRAFRLRAPAKSLSLLDIIAGLQSGRP